MPAPDLKACGFIAAALLLGSPGWAQTETTTNTTVAMPTSPVVQPGNSHPELDARGIPVISDPAVVPAGFNGTTGTGYGGPLADPVAVGTVTGSTSDHPPCTRTVTDNCVQTYERTTLGRLPRCPGHPSCRRREG